MRPCALPNNRHVVRISTQVLRVLNRPPGFAIFRCLGFAPHTFFTYPLCTLVGPLDSIQIAVCFQGLSAPRFTVMW